MNNLFKMSFVTSIPFCLIFAVVADLTSIGFLIVDSRPADLFVCFYVVFLAGAAFVTILNIDFKGDKL